MAVERIAYDDFRTGLTFREVRRMLWSYDPDPSTWRYKRRGTVLGLWHQIKRELYARYLDACDLEDEAAAREVAKGAPRVRRRAGGRPERRAG